MLTLGNNDVPHVFVISDLDKPYFELNFCRIQISAYLGSKYRMSHFSIVVCGVYLASYLVSETLLVTFFSTQGLTLTQTTMLTVHLLGVWAQCPPKIVPKPCLTWHERFFSNISIDNLVHFYYLFKYSV